MTCSILNPLLSALEKVDCIGQLGKQRGFDCRHGLVFRTALTLKNALETWSSVVEQLVDNKSV